MKRILHLALLTTAGILAGAWKADLRFTNKFAGDGGDKYPMEEKNHAYLFCENDDDARNSIYGKADWRRSNPEDYCWHEHKGSDDSWRSGWERSRLMRGCKWQLQGFGNKIYRCYDVSKDPEFSTIEQTLSTQKSAAYEEWLRVYNAKVDELDKGADQTFGDVDAEMQAALDRETKAKAEKEKMLQDAAMAKVALSDLAARHAQIDSLLGSLVAVFDSGWKTLLGKTDGLNAAIDQATANLSDFQAQLKNSDQSYSTLSALQSTAAPALDRNYAALCKGSDAGKDVETLRTQVAYMSKIIAPIQADAEALVLPEAFAGSKDELVRKVSKLNDIADKRSFIFDEFYDLLSDRPAICEQIGGFQTELGKAVALAKGVEELKVTVGVIRDMEEAIRQVEIQKEADAQHQAALFAAGEIEASFVNFLQNGRIAQARAIVDRLDDSMNRILSTPALLRSKADLVKLRSDMEQIKGRILADADTRLSLNAAHSLLTERLRQIKIRIIKLELRSKKIPALNTAWSLQKQDVFQTLNTKPGQDIFRPVFSDWSSLLAYEEMLGRMDAALDQLLTYNP